MSVSSDDLFYSTIDYSAELQNECDEYAYSTLHYIFTILYFIYHENNNNIQVPDCRPINSCIVRIHYIITLNLQNIIKRLKKHSVLFYAQMKYIILNLNLMPKLVHTNIIEYISLWLYYEICINSPYYDYYGSHAYQHILIIMLISNRNCGIDLATNSHVQTCILLGNCVCGQIILKKMSYIMLHINRSTGKMTLICLPKSGQLDSAGLRLAYGTRQESINTRVYGFLDQVNNWWTFYWFIYFH